MLIFTASDRLPWRSLNSGMHKAMASLAAFFGRGKQ